MKNISIAYLLARMPIAMSMFGHGLVRIPKLEKFSAGIDKQFTNTMLPQSLVHPYSIALPFLELLTGVLLILGLFTRFVNVLGVAIVLSLIFGSTMLEKWDAVFTQIIYGAYFALLYLFADHNRYSVDQLITGNQSNLV